MFIHEYLIKAIQDDARRAGERDRLLREARRARRARRQRLVPAAPARSRTEMGKIVVSENVTLPRLAIGPPTRTAVSSSRFTGIAWSELCCQLPQMTAVRAAVGSWGRLRATGGAGVLGRGGRHAGGVHGSAHAAGGRCLHALRCSAAGRPSGNPGGRGRAVDRWARPAGAALRQRGCVPGGIQPGRIRRRASHRQRRPRGRGLCRRPGGT